ncbi:MAG: DUF4249 domain-containing protein [Marinifilaceae bacterium]|jgi:hypothetical protein|nr:DUF4249 domain-containing protein [Marinifilaceae bacterium]
MKAIYIFTILAISLLFISCESVVDYDLPPAKEKLVISCIFDQLNTWQADVSVSKTITKSDEKKKISDAKLSLFNNKTNDKLGEFVYNTDAQSYKLTLPIDPNIEYRIEAEKDGYDKASSVSKIQNPFMASIHSAELLQQSETGLYRIYVNMQDDPNAENYYLVKLLIEETYYPNWEWDPENPDYMPDPVTTTRNTYFYSKELNRKNGDVFDEVDDDYQYLIFDDKYFNGQNFKLDLYVQSYDLTNPEENKFYVELFHINKDLYEYYRTVELYDENDGNPFSQPVQIHTNIENGLGIFSGSYKNHLKFSVK